MKLGFKTFGCKANSLDTDALYLEARRRGYDIVEEEDWADAYIVNTCTVTHAADRDARFQIGKFKRQNPTALVGVVGCYAQVAKDELLALPEIDVVIGTTEKTKIFDHFDALWEQGTLERDQVLPSAGFLPETFSGSRYARAPIKIQDGCNFRCSFCIIPQARGRSRSLSLETVLHQVREAHAQGFEEIILTGIHLAHYGWDRGTSLLELLHKILEEPGPRIRLTTLDPFEIPDELIALIGKEKRLCPHFHIAIQSGSDKILNRMRRIYRVQEFRTVTEKIEKQYPDTFIGIDVIVGFPGEEEEEFNATLKCLEETFWSKLHVFPFSVRQGTAAEALDGKVEPAIITERSKILRELSENRYQAFLKSQIGKSRDVVFERPSSKSPHLWQGHTENYLPTLSTAPENPTKKTRRSFVTGVAGDRLITTLQEEVPCQIVVF